MRINLYPRFNYYFICALLLSMLTSASDLCAQAPDSLLFRDDFDRTSLGSAWEQNGSWSIADGSAYNFTSGPGETLKTTTGYSLPSYIVETAAMGFNENYYRYFRITFGQADLSNANQLYEVTYTAWQGGRLSLSRSTDNVFYPEVMDEVAIFPGLFTYNWYKFKIAKYESGLIQVFVDKGSGYDSVPLLEAIDSTYPLLGHFGWQVDTDAFPEDFYVDWMKASKPGIEKPAVREKPVEDSLITQVSAKSGNIYKVSKLNPGVKQLIDREYTITSVPDYLKGASFIQTANDDKLNNADEFLSFFVKASHSSAIIYIGYDSRSSTIPAWLSAWTKTGDSIGTSDDKVGYLSVYSKLVNGAVYPYPSTLGGNLANPAIGAQTNYLVAAILRPRAINLQAEDAVVSGAVVANDHINYNGTGFVDFKNPTNDYIEWSAQINVPGLYNLGFRYANGSIENRAMLITVNGIDAGIVNFSPGFSSSWSSWPFTSGPNKVFLSHGINLIRVSAIGTSGPNIDELSLSYSSTSAAVPASSAPIFLVGNSFPKREASEISTSQFYNAYPNPFSQSTKIYYQLKTKAKVTLAVYNSQGQQIQLLTNGIRGAGNYQATFNAGRFARGIYFYRLQIGNDLNIGKLLKE